MRPPHLLNFPLKIIHDDRGKQNGKINFRSPAPHLSPERCTANFPIDGLLFRSACSARHTMPLH